MGAVITVVSATLDEARIDGVVEAYESGLSGEKPAAILATYLARESDVVSVVTVWRDRAALDAMIASGEPFARRLLREAGGEPEAHFLDVLAAS